MPPLTALSHEPPRPQVHAAGTAALKQQRREDDELLEGVEHAGLRRVLQGVLARDPDQPEFLAAVKEVALSLQPVFAARPELLPVFEQLCEPERQARWRRRAGAPGQAAARACLGRPAAMPCAALRPTSPSPPTADSLPGALAG